MDTIYKELKSKIFIGTTDKNYSQSLLLMPPKTQKYKAAGSFDF